MSETTGGSRGRATWRWLSGLGSALLIWAVLARPVLAHGLWDGDPSHLLEDLLLSFGLPLVVLAVGALAGIVLSKWLARHGDSADELDDEPVEHDEPVARRE